MKSTQWSKIVTVLILVLAPCFSLQGAVIHQSATMGPTGQTGGYPIDSYTYLGSRFYVSNEAQVTAIGGHMLSGWPEDDIFGAIIRLSGPTDLPNGYPIDSSEVVAHTLFTPYFPSTDFRTPLSVTLTPGYYALVFGSNWYGATGTALMATDGQSDLPGASYIYWDEFDYSWYNAVPFQARFVVEGTITPTGYCAASGGCDEYISRVTVGAIDNTSICGGYQNFTPLSTTMAIGTGYPIAVTNGGPWPDDRCGIWVDWNQDLDFTDAGEEISVTGNPGEGPYTATITPPATATLGNTRIRIRIAYGLTPTPCGDFTYGEVEDYTINVTAAAPSTINISGYVKTAQGVRIKGARAAASTGPNTVSDALGHYSLTLPYNSSSFLTITATQTDWTFTALFVPLSSDLTDQNITGTYNVAYGGGSGTSSSPYLISNAAQLNGIGAKALDWNKYFLLTKDINLSGYDGIAGRPSFNRIGYYINNGTDRSPFMGVFDGGGHTISNFIFDSNAGNDGVGLFGYVDGATAQVKNVKLTNVDVNSTSGAVGTAGLIGHIYRGTVSGCYVQGGSVRSGGDNTAGLIGYAPGSGAINDCNTELLNVSGKSWVGGLIGQTGRQIYNCRSSCTITGTQYCGGLTGLSYGNVEKCGSAGSVTLTYASGGGLVGDNAGTIKQCYSTAIVSGGSSDEIGGLVGRNGHGWISNSYASGAASGDYYVGGLAGLCFEANVINCYSTGPVSATTAIKGGLIGWQTAGTSNNIIGSFWDKQTSNMNTSNGGTGKLTSEMKTLGTFTGAGWDFVAEAINGNDNFWYIKPADYPRLCWQDGVKYDGGTGTFDDPFLIYTAVQMNKIGLDINDWNNHFKLMANIDLGQYTGEAFNIIGYGTSLAGGLRFSGYFDGNWHTISNFHYTSSNNGDYIGIFGTISGRVKNLGLINPQISHTFTTTAQVGALAGRLEGNMEGCWVQGGSIDGNDCVGGLVGYCFSGYMTNCWSTAQVKGATYVGGLLGDSSFGSENIFNCYAQGSVTGKDCVGGLAGYAIGILKDCYSSGAVTGDSNVGGLIGFTDPCSLFASNLFWNTDTSGRTTSAAGQGKTNAQMLDMSTFTNAGWDFAGELNNGPGDNWVMPPLGGPYPGYPVMWYQLAWPALPSFAAGSGTEEDPYEISTALELRSIGDNPRLMDKYYILTADITLADTNFPIIGSMGYPFIGGFDGQGHTITNLRYKSFWTTETGMFGYVGPDYLAVSSSQPRVEIKNIRLISPRIETTYSFGSGSLVGRAGSGTQIVNCHADDANISGYEYIGGLVGHITFGNIKRSSAKGYVSCSDWDSGGLVGYSLRSNIEDCYSNGQVSNGYSAAGGLIGANNSGTTVTRCYSSAVVSGPQNTGGLVGSSSSSCVYRTSFCDATVNPGMQPIGNATDGNVVALPTEQMYMQSTYINAGWDFIGETDNGPNDIWKINEGQDYPRFAWEQPPPIENITFELDLSKLWMYQNLPNQTKSNITAQLNESTFNDPANNGDLAFYWEIELPDDVTVMPITTAGGDIYDTSWTFAAPSCSEWGVSDSGQTFKVRLRVVGSDSGNFGIAEKEFAIALLGDVDNNGSVNVADRSIINVFWRTGSAGPYTLEDCDLTCDGVVNVADRSIANSVWRGAVGSNSVASPCPIH